MEVRSEQPFTMSMQKNPVATHPSLSGMRLMFGPEGSAIFKPTTSASNSSSPASSFHGGNTGTGSQPSPFHGGNTGTGSQPSPFHGGSSGTGSQPSPFHGGSSGTGSQPSPFHGGNSGAISQPPSFHGGSAGVGGLSDSGGAGGDVALAAPVVSIHGLNAGGHGEQIKKKRGRPRKYSADGSMALALSTVSPTSTASPGSAVFSPSSGQPNAAFSISGDPTKKARGRPPGSSGKKQQMLALGSVGTGFTPHVIAVKAGEDVSSKIMSFSQNGPRAVCILSANGAISNVTLRQAATSGGTVTYEGRFEILSLSGSFLLSENGGQRSRTGGLSVSLAGPDGRVIGGGVAGLLTAASPVQVVVGSFIADGKKAPKHTNFVNTLSSAAKLGPADGIGAGAGGGLTVSTSSPPSRGTASESSGGPPSPLNQSTGTFNNTNLLGMSNLSWK
ncbi:AT-hook motif nuclear-localized protein 10-like [Phalaenopsis equestris]|uniref:AT-hook motif nuclear-localized protein 10-like n=1 Tax=Phalaenopsis equestris TaxID=78828 RepID=UPI0009E5769E|nr:AT-hook motif nuclear-localized protein 10-like [Phalaenopsis equestris]XP_020589675.1 AT-hook motif nuclear-localized protein 10-like [Phalaenopsis equestris]